MNNIEIDSAVLERVLKIPIFETLKFEIKHLSDGKCKAFVPRDTKYDGIFETFHGGLLMTIADSISACAILTKTGAESMIATTDMNIRFLAPCKTGVIAEAIIIKLGRTLCPVAVELYDENSHRVAVAQVNYMVIR